MHWQRVPVIHQMNTNQKWLKILLKVECDSKSIDLRAQFLYWWITRSLPLLNSSTGTHISILLFSIFIPLEFRLWFIKIRFFFFITVVTKPLINYDLINFRHLMSTNVIVQWNVHLERDNYLISSLLWKQNNWNLKIIISMTIQQIIECYF